MHTAYLDGLIDALRRSEITRRDGQPMEWEAAFEEVVGCFSRARHRGSQLFFVGNGGSAAIAHHMTTDFMKNGGMRTVSLLNSSLLTCMGNDYGYEQVLCYGVAFFRKQAKVKLLPGK